LTDPDAKAEVLVQIENSTQDLKDAMQPLLSQQFDLQSSSTLLLEAIYGDVMGVEFEDLPDDKQEMIVSKI
jgi:hypothetical protein